MKSRIQFLLILLALILLIKCKKDNSNSPVGIHDQSFLDALVESGYDTNGDGNISFAEARAIKSLNINGFNISDMSGIESFSNLEMLNCGNNTFTELNLNSNHALKILIIVGGNLVKLNIFGATSLTALDCNGNKLTNLDVSKNSLLDSLECGNNQIERLSFTNNLSLRTVNCSYNNLSFMDVSKNTDLSYLDCSNNKLSTLDISNNLGLTYLVCSQNILTTLDVSKNTSLKNLFLSNMPSLSKVCVWVLPFPPTGVSLDYTNSSHVYFTTDCCK